MKKIITFLILLFGVIATLTAQTLEKGNLYLVGQFSSWAFYPEYQFSIVDDDDFILEFPAGQELQLSGQFKIASYGWSGPYDFGGNYSVDVDSDYTLIGTGNLNAAKVITVSKVEFNLTTQVLRLSGVSTAKVFDTTKDYGFYLNADETDNPFVFKGNGVYEATYTMLNESSFGFKVGDAGYSSIELGGVAPLDEVVLGEPYQMAERNYVLYTPTLSAGTELLFTLTITSDWKATMLVTEKTTTEPGPDPIDPPVDIVTEVYLQGTFTQWAAEEAYKLTSTDGDYFVATYTAGNEVEITGNFKVATADWQTIDYGGNYIVEPGIEYQLEPIGGNLAVSGKIVASKIEFTLSTATLKITGITQENKFDLTSDFGISFVESLDNINYYPLTFEGNGVYTGTYEYTGVDPELDQSMYTPKFKIGGLEDMLTIDYGGAQTLELGVPYTLTRGSFYFVEVYETLEIGVKYDVKVTFTEDWGATLLLTKQTVTPEPDPDPIDPPVDIVTEIYVKGTFNQWSADETYKLTSTDGNYFVATYTSGNEVELTGNFKLATADWNTIDYGGNYIVEPGMEYQLVSMGENLAVSGKIVASKIEFTLSTATLKITGKTQENKFDLTSDIGISFVESLGEITTYYPLTFEGNGVYTGTYEYRGGDLELDETIYLPLFKVGGLEDMLTIDYGSVDTRYLELGVPYTLKRGSFYFVEVYETLEVGTKYDVTVTFTEDWGATLLLTKQTVTPDPGPTPEPDTSIIFVAGNGNDDVSGIWCNGYEWASPGAETANRMTDENNDGIYEITFDNVPAGTWAFQVVLQDEESHWYYKPHLDIEASSTNISDDETNIKFTLNQAADVTIKFNTITEKIILTTPSGSFDKLRIEHFHVYDYTSPCADKLEFTKENNYTVTFGTKSYLNYEERIEKVEAAIYGDCNFIVYSNLISTEVPSSGNYNVTVVFNGNYDKPEFTISSVEKIPSNYFVAGNGGSDATGIWCNGNEWGTDAAEFANNMTDADNDGIYEITFKQVPAGTWSFKVVEGPGYTKWRGSDYIDEENSSKGYELALNDGNISFTLNETADVTIKFNYLTNKIILTTPSGNFGEVQIEYLTIVAWGEDCLEENTFSKSNSNKIRKTEYVEVDEQSGTAYITYRILGNCNYAVYEKSIYTIVTESGTYDVIIVFNGDYENPDFEVIAEKQGGSDEPEPDPTPTPIIRNLEVPSFGEVEVNTAKVVTATFALENATEATATLSGDAAFYIQKQSVENGNGTVQILFMPETAGTYNGTLIITSGKVIESINFSAKAIEADVEPEVLIENLQAPYFEAITVGDAAVATATYTLVNAQDAEASLSGSDAFIITKQSVENGKGTVQIVFIPESAGAFKATLTITSGNAISSVDFSAMANNVVVEPSIENLIVPAFEEMFEGEFKKVTATYTLVNATEAKASISGSDAFIINKQSVSDGQGSVEIFFMPEKAGYYTAILTITSGSVSESVEFSALAKLPASEDTDEVSIESLIVPEFASITAGETTTVIASYILRGAKEATATLSGDDNYFTILSQSVNNGIGMVEIQFAPNVARTFRSTLTITSGNTSESVDFSVTSRLAPMISSLSVSEFGTTLVGETSVALASYTLDNADNAVATLSDNDVFTIRQQLVSNGQGMVRIQFSPKEAGKYSAILTITSGITEETINITAEAIEYVEPGPEVEPVISGLYVPDFGEVYVGETAQVVAMYTIENAEKATATLSGDAAFKITLQLLNSGSGVVRIAFSPEEVGTYKATLTITSGNVSESIEISAVALEEGGDEPDPEPTPDPEPDPTPDPEPEPDPSPYAEYPLIGYFYWVNIGIEYEPDLEWVKTDNSYEFNLEEIESYQPVWNSRIDVDLVPEKLEQKIYGLDIYKFEVRDKEKISYVRDGGYSRSFEFKDVDITKTPYYANGVWYESIEEMMTWYVRYVPYWDDEASEVMIEESPGVFVATLSPKEETDEDDYYYYCLGNVEDPIIVVGIGPNAWNIQNYLQIPQGFKVMAYLEDANWNTYYKLVPPGDGWDKDYVDLGLPSGLCWAVKNLGADKPEDEGHHYAWGEVEPKEDYSYQTYKWANLLKNNEYIKYVTDDWYGLIDFRTTLEPNDDAANVALGSKWHIPSKLDTQELLKECTTEFGYYYGVKGYFITGPNGNAIFLPGAVERKGTDHDERGNGGSYWTSTLYDDTNSKANKLVFNLTYIDSEDNDYASRTDGLVIRPVIHRDYVAIDEVPAIDVYAKEGTIYSELDFEIYNLTGLNVTHLNGSLEGIYIVKTAEGNRLISVW